jgi:uncharacterized protein
VEFEPEALSFDTYFGLKESLEALFGRGGDLVEPGAIRNPYFKESVDGTKVPLYVARTWWP